VAQLFARLTSLCGILVVSSTAFGQGTAGSITVHLDRPGVKISPTFYGLMTEEINHSYDGGLYGELIENRALKDNRERPIHWSAIGDAAISLDESQHVPGTALTNCLKIQSSSTGAAAGAANSGYWGIPVRPGTAYRVSFYAKADGGTPGPVQVSIQSNDGHELYAVSEVTLSGSGWKRYDTVLHTGKLQTTRAARFAITTNHAGVLYVTQVSLFSPTYFRRTNGNRIDLMEKLGELNPSFLRLPGGNYLEGNTIPERFDWKATIGDISQRPGHQGPWGYRSTDGLGLLEFLEWCEDLHMQPVLAVYAGYSLGGDHVEPGDKLQPFVQDALDEIEYVTGGPDTKWGRVRAENGHRRPFPLTYVEIGNEDWFDRSRTYPARFAQFYDAIKAKYPKLQLISTAPIESRPPDVVDDHYYRSPLEMERDSGHYDTYPRSGPKIFVGEWASIQGNPTPTMNAALGDASWLTGLERNSDLVVMESYAPLLVNVNPGAAQWGTNLIGYDALTSFGSPSFYVQSMFAKNTGDTVLPEEVKVTPPATKPQVFHGKIGLGTWLTDSEYKDIEVIQDGKTVYQKDFANGDDGWKLGDGAWKVDDGSLRQTNVEQEDARALAGDIDWQDYTYHLKARKLGGAEGFLILFHVHDDQNYWQWNIGGWGDTRSAFQIHQDGTAVEVGRATRTRVETGRWYDIRIEIHNGLVKCYLDDKLITQFDEHSTTAAAGPIYSSASVDSKTGDVFVKVVNVSDSDLPLDVVLSGSTSTWGKVTGEQLHGNPTEINSVAEPTKVAPVSVKLAVHDSKIVHTYPAHSVTVFRVRANH
jgi:alpha-L-arabinofuranosidase